MALDNAPRSRSSGRRPSANSTASSSSMLDMGSPLTPLNGTTLGEIVGDMESVRENATESGRRKMLPAYSYMSESFFDSSASIATERSSSIAVPNIPLQRMLMKNALDRINMARDAPPRPSSYLENLQPERRPPARLQPALLLASPIMERSPRYYRPRPDLVFAELVTPESSTLQRRESDTGFAMPKSPQTASFPRKHQLSASPGKPPGRDSKFVRQEDGERRSSGSSSGESSRRPSDVVRSSTSSSSSTDLRRRALLSGFRISDERDSQNLSGENGFRNSSGSVASKRNSPVVARGKTPVLADPGNGGPSTPRTSNPANSRQSSSSGEAGDEENSTFGRESSIPVSARNSSSSSGELSPRPTTSARDHPPSTNRQSVDVRGNSIPHNEAAVSPRSGTPGQRPSGLPRSSIRPVDSVGRESGSQGRSGAARASGSGFTPRPAEMNNRSSRSDQSLPAHDPGRRDSVSDSSTDEVNPPNVNGTPVTQNTPVPISEPRRSTMRLLDSDGRVSQMQRLSPVVRGSAANSQTPRGSNHGSGGRGAFTPHHQDTRASISASGSRGAFTPHREETRSPGSTPLPANQLPLAQRMASSVGSANHQVAARGSHQSVVNRDSGGGAGASLRNLFGTPTVVAPATIRSEVRHSAVHNEPQSPQLPRFRDSRGQVSGGGSANRSVAPPSAVGQSIRHSALNNEPQSGDRLSQLHSSNVRSRHSNQSDSTGGSADRSAIRPSLDRISEDSTHPEPVGNRSGRSSHSAAGIIGPTESRHTLNVSLATTPEGRGDPRNSMRRPTTDSANARPSLALGEPRENSQQLTPTRQARVESTGHTDRTSVRVSTGQIIRPIQDFTSADSRRGSGRIADIKSLSTSSASRHAARMVEKYGVKSPPGGQQRAGSSAKSPIHSTASTLSGRSAAHSARMREKYGTKSPSSNPAVGGNSDDDGSGDDHSFSPGHAAEGDSLFTPENADQTVVHRQSQLSEEKSQIEDDQSLSAEEIDEIHASGGSAQGEPEADITEDDSMKGISSGHAPAELTGMDDATRFLGPLPSVLDELPAKPAWYANVTLLKHMVEQKMAKDKTAKRNCEGPAPEQFERFYDACISAGFQLTSPTPEEVEANENLLKRMRNTIYPPSAFYRLCQTYVPKTEFRDHTCALSYFALLHRLFPFPQLLHRLVPITVNAWATRQ